MKTLKHAISFVTLFYFLLVRLPAQISEIVYRPAIDSLLAQYPAGKGSPGYAVAIIQNGQIIYSKNDGMANIKMDLPITQESQFNIGSVTKQFTATAILLLEEQKKLSLEEEIHTYIPELPEYGYPITIRNLLSHTSGIRDQFILAYLLNRYTPGLRSAKGMMQWEQKYDALNFIPGTNFAYTNAGYMLLALVIEKVSGMSYANFLQENIFTPLQMNSTYIETERTKEQRDHTTHYYYNKKWTRVKGPYNIKNAIGAVGVISHIHDMVLWDQNFYHNVIGTSGIDFITEMETSFLLNDSIDCNYNNGLIHKTYHALPVIEHSGGWGEYLLQIRRFPNKQLTIMIFCNSMRFSPFAMCDEISNVLVPYKPLRILQPITNTDLDLNSFAGTYFSVNNLSCTVVVKNNSLTIIQSNPHSQSVFPLKRISDNGNVHWFLDSTATSVHFDQVDGQQILYWSNGNYFNNPAAYIRDPQQTEIGQGRYYSRDINKHASLKYNRNKEEYDLFVFPKRYTLYAIGGSTFKTTNGKYIVHFSNNGMTIGNDWVLNVLFQQK